MSVQKKKKQKADKHVNEVVYGVNAIVEMLRAKKRRLVSIYTVKPLPKAWSKIKPYLPQKNVQIQYVNEQILRRMAGSPDHRGIVALTTPFKYQLKIFDPKKYPFLLLLDSIQDVHNLGAILRSAYCAGVDGVVLCQKGAAPMTPTVFKVSSGYAEYLDIHVVPSLSHGVQVLKKTGYHLYMTTFNGKNALEVQYQKPLCLVIGNEAVGIAKDVLKFGEKITLPQRNADISYNAAVATAICLFVLSTKSGVLSFGK